MSVLDQFANIIQEAIAPAVLDLKGKEDPIFNLIDSTAHAMSIDAAGEYYRGQRPSPDEFVSECTIPDCKWCEKRRTIYERARETNS